MYNLVSGYWGAERHQKLILFVCLIDHEMLHCILLMSELILVVKLLYNVKLVVDNKVNKHNGIKTLVSSTVM